MSSSNGAVTTRTITMRKVSEVFDIAAPDHVTVPVFDEPTPDVPQVDPLYVFERDSLKKVLQWLDGSYERNIMLTGPTGCGKSSLIEQVAARLNVEVFTIGCHEKMEFGEMLGSTQLVPGRVAKNDNLLKRAASALSSLFKGSNDGESLVEWIQRCLSLPVSQYAYGALSLAVLRGGICLLDEINFLHPGTIGALNRVLDSKPLLIAETGELIDLTPGFRIAVTGNALDGGDSLSLHKGVKRMNPAFSNRFLTMQCDYMPAIQEAMVLGRAVSLPGALIEDMLTVAGEVRKAYKGSVVQTVVSTRIITRWAKLIESNRGRLGTQPAEVISDALSFALLDGADPVDASAVQKILSATIDGKVYTSSPSGKSQPAGPQLMHLYVNPNAGSPKYWGSIVKGDGQEYVFWGAMGNQLAGEDKPSGYVGQKSAKKMQEGYLPVSLPSAVPDAHRVIRELCCDWYLQLRAGSTVRIPNDEHRQAMLKIAEILGSTWNGSIVS